MKCNICGTQKFSNKNFFFGFDLDAEYIHICSSCELGQINYNKKKLLNYYNENLQEKLVYDFSLDQKMQMHPYVKAATQYKKIKNVLDIGCGNGTFLFSAKKNNLDYVGIEPNKNKFQNCLNLGLENVYNLDFSNYYKKKDTGVKNFDFIVIDNVLEHVPDPIVFLNEVKKLLSNKGIIFIAVPNCNKEYYKCRSHDFSPHLFFYSKKSLERLFQTLKLEIVEMGSYGKKFSKNLPLRVKNNTKHFVLWFLKKYIFFVYEKIEKISMQKKKLKKKKEITRSVNKQDFLNSFDVNLSKNFFEFDNIYTFVKKV